MDNINRGDIYYIVSNYQEEGSEQRAGRPAIIVSNDMCNQHSGVVEIVYLTTQPKTDLPTHIDIHSRPFTALCEQICSVSKDRLGNYIGACSDYELKLLDAALLISLGIDVPKTEKPKDKKEDKPQQLEVFSIPRDDDMSEIKICLTKSQEEEWLYERCIGSRSK